MKDVSITVSAINTAVPAGTAAGMWNFKVLDKATAVTIINEDQVAKTFTTQLENGDYRATVVRMSAEVATGGATPSVSLGDPAMADFTVKDGHIIVETASNVIVEVSDGADAT